MDNKKSYLNSHRKRPELQKITARFYALGEVTSDPNRLMVLA